MGNVHDTKRLLVHFIMSTHSSRLAMSHHCDEKIEEMHIASSWAAPTVLLGALATRALAIIINASYSMNPHTCN